MRADHIDVKKWARLLATRHLDALYLRDRERLRAVRQGRPVVTYRDTLDRVRVIDLAGKSGVLRK